MTLGDALNSDRSRTLDLLRQFLAVAVIVSHAWPLALGPGAQEPLEALTGRSLGGWAVGIFFFISGMLITASAERRSGLRFWAARARRILPGLGAALLVTLALALASGSTASGQEAFIWFVRAFTLVSIEYRLTDAFAANPFPAVVNGPLWSLFHEVVAYMICALFVWSGGARNPRTVLVLLCLAVVAGLAHGILPGRLATLAPLFAAFAFGMAAYVWRNRIALTPGIALCVLPAALVLPWSLAIGAVGLGIVVLMLCTQCPCPRNDASYGLYIYGWPVAQAIVSLSPGIGPLALACASVVATYPLALLSWRLVEAPGMRARRVSV